MLDGLDDVAWGGLTHAYGSAEDTAEMLRQAASEDGEMAAEAVSDLHGSIFHQGTVYPATVAAVPFLALLAQCAPYRRDDFVWMLGMLADPRHAYGEAFPRTRAAVAEQGQIFVTLLDDNDARVREAAAYAAVRADTTAEALWRQWAVESDPAVQASLTLALGEVDPGAAGAVLADVAAHGCPEVRVAAAVALLRAGLPWSDGTIAAVVDAIDEGAKVAYSWARGADWYEELLVTPPTSVAVEILRQMLGSRNPKTRKAGIWAMGERCNAWRSAPAVFVPMVAPAVHDPDPDVRGEAIGALRRAGAVAGRYADVLASVAAGFPDVAGERGFTVEYQATATLLRLGDPRWIEPVCEAAARGHQVRFLLGGARFSPTVLAAVRDRLVADPTRADVLAGALGQWGADAATAVPDLLTAMPHAGPQVAAALLELGQDVPAALPHLRTRVAETGDLRAGMAVWRMTGDAEPTLGALHAALVRGGNAPPTSAFISEMGAILLPLLPAARNHLTGTAARTYPQRETQILAARLVAATTEPQAVLPTVRAVLAGGHTPARAAADLIADLTHADPTGAAILEPDLRHRLDDPWNRLAAARALARLGAPTAELAGPLVSGITDYGGRFALTIILELCAVEAIPALEKLVDQDERLSVSGSYDDLVWADELLRERVGRAIADLRDMAPRTTTTPR
jgi:hypothetical protein